jgi:hypothetical protein
MTKIRQLGNYRVTKIDAEFHCVHKPPPKILLGVCVFALIWTIICVILCVIAFKETSFSSLFFVILFCFFECVILYGLAQTFFGKETLTLNADGFLYCRTLFRFCKTREIPIKDVEKIACIIRKKESDENCAYGNLHIFAFSHPAIELFERIPENELREMFSLIRETYEHFRPNDFGYGEIFSIVDGNMKTDTATQ